MEAIRPKAERPVHASRPATTAALIDVEDAVELPPPPAPFPPDFLMYSSETTLQDTARIHINLTDIQRSCVHALTSLLPENAMTNDSVGGLLMSDEDQQLARALSELLEVSYELEALQPGTDLQPEASTSTSSPKNAQNLPTSTSISKPVDIQSSYAALINHLTDLQTAMQNRQSSAPAVNWSPLVSNSASALPPTSDLQPAINVVREELAWARIETLSHAVLELVRARHGPHASDSVQDPFATAEDRDRMDEPPVYSRSERLDSATSDVFPPSYQDHEDAVDAFEGSGKVEKENPGFDKDCINGEETAAATVKGSGPANEEKMIRDLDAVTQAIERLHAIAPQLHNQRSELRPPNSSTNGATSSTTLRGESIRHREKMRELDDIWGKIERAHGKRRNREMDEQRADMNRNEVLHELYERAEEGRRQVGEPMRRSIDADFARARELRDRDHFLRELLEQSGERRMSDQDARTSDGALTLTDKRQTFLDDLMSKTRVGRMSGQDYPQSMETRLMERKENFIDTIVDYSSSGRMHDQDSLPPTPSNREEDPHELVTAHAFLSTSSTSNNASSTSVLTNGSGTSRRGSTSIGMERGSSGDSTSSNKARLRSNSAGAFKKLAGMVRRGSLGLALKSGSGLDATSVSYIAEHQENLHTVQVMLHGAGVTTNPDLMLQTGPDDTTLVSKSDPSLVVPIALPAAVHPSQVIPLTSADLFSEAKLSAIPVPSKPPALNSAITHALSAPELRGLQPKALCCTSCDREVADLSVPSKDPDEGYKDLPSEFWAEMMEVWMCHADPSFTARLAKRTKDGFWPTKSTVLVGGSYLLVEGSEVKDAHMIVHESAKSDQWRVIQCTCGEVLGKQRTKDGKPGAGAVRFSKWSIALLCDDDDTGERVEPVRFALSTFLVSDMLELAQAHASYRFIISDEETGERRLALWLFNPSIGISYRRPPIASPLPSPLRASFTDKSAISSSMITAAGSSGNGFSGSGNGSAPSFAAMVGNGGSGGVPGIMSRRSSNASFSSLHNGRSPRRPPTSTKTLRAAKIMYKVLDPFLGNVDDTLQTLPGFGASGQIEQLLYSRDACVRLTAALKESTTIYPFSRRTMGPFEIGFLERF